LKTDFGKFSTNSYNLIRKTDIGRGFTRLMKWTRKIGDQYIQIFKNPKHALENSDLAKSDVGKFTTHIGNDLRLNRLSIQPFIKASADITFEDGEIGFTSDFQFGLNISIKHRNRYIINFDLGNEPGGRGEKNDYGSPDPDFLKYDEED
jgi:hypothetical protein